jgi:tetratricopeptide (TPR) repeat protein
MLFTTPDTMQLMLRQGDLHRLMGRWDDALMLFDKVLASPGLALDASLMRLQTLLEAGRVELGLEAANTLVEQHPTCGKAHLFRARLLAKHGMFDFAAVAYRISLELLDPPLPEHFLEAARVLVQTPGHGEAAAIDLISMGLRNLGHDIELEIGALELELDLGRFEEASVRLQKLLAKPQAFRKFSKQQICMRLLDHCKTLPHKDSHNMIAQLRQHLQPSRASNDRTHIDFATTY